jgi:DNA-binding transcriptional regulator YiaG
MPRNQPTKALRLKEANRLKRLRDALKLTQVALAQEFNVAQGAIAQWERGDRTLPGPILRLIEIYESGAVVTGQKKKRI